MDSNEIQLHDIKPLLEVEEYSFYYFLGLSGLGVLVLALLVYGLYVFYKRSKRVSTRKLYKKKLESLKNEDTKETAYALSIYGAIFEDDSPQHKEVFSKLKDKLSGYKYQKNVENFDNETLECIELYKGMLDV